MKSVREKNIYATSAPGRPENNKNSLIILFLEKSNYNSFKTLIISLRINGHEFPQDNAPVICPKSYITEIYSKQMAPIQIIPIVKICQ